MVALCLLVSTKNNSHSDDIDKVILPQCVQDRVDGVLGDGHFQALHAATDVHHDDDVLGRCGCLDVPTKTTQTDNLVNDTELCHTVDHDRVSLWLTAQQYLQRHAKSCSS